MKASLKYLPGLALSALFVGTVSSGPDDFKTGPVLEAYGKTAPVEADFVIPKRAKLKVAFDVSKEAKAGSVNRSLDSAARFVNMHAASGMKEKNVKAALIIHGPAAIDLTRDARYGAENAGAENASAPLIKALTEHGVRVILCGQTAAYRDIEKADLLPGVEMALSAMTAHAVLQNEGYTLNPF